MTAAFLTDLAQATHRLRRAPALPVLIVVAMAFGIGATTAAFTVVQAVLLEPLPYQAPERLVMVWGRWAARPGEADFVSPGDFTDWRRMSRSFARLEALRSARATLDVGGEPTVVRGFAVTPGLFETLGVRPLLGRGFRPSEDARSQVVILGYGISRRLGTGGHPVGRTIRIGRDLHTVVGVMPRGFDFPRDAELWFPASLDPDERSNRGLRVLGRLAPGVDLAEAQAEMNALSLALARAHPRHNAGHGAVVVPLEEHLVGPVRASLLILLGAVASVLLMTCINTAAALHVRMGRRSGELAVRAALGAGRWRMVRLLVGEGVLLTGAGGVLGALGGFWLIELFAALDPFELPRIAEVRVDAAILLFPVLATAVCGALVALPPALRLTRQSTAGALLGRTQHPGFVWDRRSGSLLLVVQVGAATILLTVAGLFLQSFFTRVTMPLGFRPEGTVAVRVPWGAGLRVDSLLERLRALPGVEAVGASTSLPHETPNTLCTGCVEIEGVPPIAGDLRECGQHVVSPGFFRATGIALRRGRLLNRYDDANGAPACVVTRAFARRFLGGAAPLGRRVRWSGGTWHEIVGVVDDVRGLDGEYRPQPSIYLPRAQLPEPDRVSLFAIVLRTSLPTGTMAATLRGQLRNWEPGLPIGRIASLGDLMSDSIAPRRFFVMLLAGFTAAALLVAALGLYATVSLSVATRTHEIGVRMALGARAAGVLALVFRHCARLLAMGVAGGLLASWYVSRILTSMLFGIGPHDPVVFLGVPGLVSATALAAAYFPARRAVRIDPLDALRCE